MRKKKGFEILIVIALLFVFTLPSTNLNCVLGSETSESYSGNSIEEITQMKKSIIRDKQRELSELKLTQEEKQYISNLKKDTIKFYLNEDLLLEDENYTYDIQHFYIELLENLVGIDIELIEPIIGVTPLQAIEQGIADFSLISDYTVIDVPNMVVSDIYATEKVYFVGSKETVVNPYNNNILVFQESEKYQELDGILSRTDKLIYYNELSEREKVSFKTELANSDGYVGFGNFADVDFMAVGTGAYLIEHSLDLPLKFVSDDAELMAMFEKIHSCITDYDLYSISRIFNNKKLQKLFLDILNEDENKIIQNIGNVFYYDNISYELDGYESYYYKYVDTLIQLITGVSNASLQKNKLPDEIMYLSNLVVKVVIDSNYNDYSNYYKTSSFEKEKLDLFTIVDENSQNILYDLSNLKNLNIGVLDAQEDVIKDNMLNKYGITSDRIIVYESVESLLNALVNKDIDFCITFPGIYDNIKYNVFEKFGAQLYNNNFLLEYEDWSFISNSYSLTTVLDKYILILNRDRFYQENLINSYLNSSISSSNNEANYKFAITLLGIGISLALFYLLKTYDIKELIEKSKKYDQEKGVYSYEGFKDYIKDSKSEYIIATIKLINFYTIKTIYKESVVEEFNSVIATRLKTLNFTSKNELFKVSDDEYYIFINDKNETRQKIEKEILIAMQDDFLILDKKIKVNYLVNIINSAYIKRDNIEVVKFVEFMHEKMDSSIRKNGILNFKNYMYSKLVDNIRLEEIMSNFDISCIEPYYQPIANVKNGEVVGCEAFARIKQGKKVYVAAEFLDISTKTDQIKFIDEYLLNIILTKRNNLLNRKIIDDKFTFSVNLSENFVSILTSDLLNKLCKYHKLEKLDFVIFEMPTESANNPKLAEKLEMIRSFGIKICVEIDSKETTVFNLIDTEKIDIVKFDKSSILYKKEELIDIVKVVIGFEKLESICKFVETNEEYSYLKKIGFERLQGYYFSQPKSYEEFIEYLKL